MSNNIKREMDKIEIPNHLHERSMLGIQKAKLEMPKKKPKWSKTFTMAASLVIVLGGYGIYKDILQTEQISPSPNVNIPIVVKDDGLKIPAIELPEDTGGAEMNMIGLIVYNGKIYTQTATEIDPTIAKNVLDTKLGTTKGGIDEWSKQDQYAVEFASTIGVVDVYSVKGYDKDFRIMSYTEIDGEVYSEYYECLNGMTVHSGEDIFGKLELNGHIQSAQYRTYSDWDLGVEQFYPIEDMELLKKFADELDHAVPFSRASIEETLGDFRNDENYRQMTIKLNDGTKVSMVVLKDGYIHYSYSDVYFKIDNGIFNEIWAALNTHSASK